MGRKNTWAFERVDRGMTLITATAYDPRTGQVVASLGSEFNQNEIGLLVVDLCRCAGLPEPWKD